MAARCYAAARRAAPCMAGQELVRPMKKQAPIARPEDGNPPAQERALAWLTKNSLAATAISGGAIYLLTIEEYRQAYRPYGVSPAEVGLDYTTAVWPAAQALLFIALIAYVLTDLLPTRLLVRSRASRFFAALSVGCALVIASLFTARTQFAFAVEAGDHYDQVLNGRLSLLNALRADRVEIAWKEASPQRPGLPTGRLLLLGTSAGTLIVFSADTKTTWRIPLGDSIVRSTLRYPKRHVGGGGPIELP